MTEHTGACYEPIAGKYAAAVDSRPWNAHLERPAVVSMLPPLADTRVLDVGCGPGWYAEYLVNRGATVTSFDFNAEFVALTRARVGDRATVLQADLAEPLAFAGDEEFDLVVCPLVMHYLRDWQPALRELHRVLKPQGVLVLSTHHPFMDFTVFKKEDYFATELLEDDWDWLGKVNYYRRPLTAITTAVTSSGFWIEQMLEPQPTEDFRRVDPANYEHVTKNPWFLVIRARKKDQSG